MLTVLLLRYFLAQFTLCVEQAPVHNFERFVLFGFRQRSPPRVIERARGRSNVQFSIAPRALTSARNAGAERAALVNCRTMP